MLPPSHRLRRASDLAYVRRKGRPWSSGLFVLLAVPHHDEVAEPATRFAIVAGRRVGNAVERNRIKRRTREIVRRQLPAIESGYDCMIIARAATAQASFTEMEADLLRLLCRAKLIGSDRSLAEYA